MLVATETHGPKSGEARAAYIKFSARVQEQIVAMYVKANNTAIVNNTMQCEEMERFLVRAPLMLQMISLPSIIFYHPSGSRQLTDQGELLPFNFSEASPLVQ